MARVALYGGGGSPYHHAAVLAARGHHVAFLFPDEVRAGALEAFDVVVVPGGGHRAMLGQLEPLGSEGARAIARFVEAGGMYVSSCAGSYCAANVGPAFRAECPVKDDLDLLDARVWNDDPRYAFGLRSPGVGVLRLRNVAPEHPVMRGLPERFPIVHYNGPLFVGATALAVVDGRGEAFTEGERFLDPGAPDDLIERAAAEGVASVVVGERGAGRVVLFGSHPEFGVRPAMDDEMAAAQMLANAVQWQVDEAGERDGALPRLAMDGAENGDVGAVISRVGDVRAAAADLAASGPGAWLGRERAMSIFGREPQEIVAGALEDIDRLAAELAEAAPSMPSHILGFRAPAGYDGGYTGVVALLDIAIEQLRTALRRWDAEPGPPPENAYAELDVSPYHLVAASYLAAVGTVASAALLGRAMAAR
jgi:putative intracellular protease/amidase